MRHFHESLLNAETSTSSADLESSQNSLPPADEVTRVQFDNNLVSFWSQEAAHVLVGTLAATSSQKQLGFYGVQQRQSKFNAYCMCREPYGDYYTSAMICTALQMRISKRGPSQNTFNPEGYCASGLHANLKRLPSSLYQKAYPPIPSNISKNMPTLLGILALSCNGMNGMTFSSHTLRQVIPRNLPPFEKFPLGTLHEKFPRNAYGHCYHATTSQFDLFNFIARAGCRCRPVSD